MITILLQIVNAIFDHGSVPDILKVGLLTPVFKNKGNIAEVINYRGITVLPVINKIIETIIKNRTNHNILAIQNPIQRGFTKGSSPLNSALPVEETYRENADNKNECQLVLLDAKSAFDVVIHSHLMRRVYHAGIQDKHWSLINSMHQKASSSVKWDNKISQRFPVTQGVRQGGILSSDLYKVYINPLLNNLSDSYLGMKIGNVNCNASACADDVALMSRREHETQVMINIAHEFATMEGYKLQPSKSVIINIQPNKRKQSMMDQEYILENNVMPNVKQAIHLGIIRTNTLADNMTVNVEENIKKSRRSAYGLFGGGFHGNNGLDPETLIHLFNTYITPVLMYGMELIIPKTTALEQLERYQK